jgi:hypothetical protein
MSKYKVSVYIQGGISRPPYHSTVTVYAEDDDAAAEKAIRDLRRGTFQDVGASSMKIEKVEKMYS